jgi:hypothetical protein
MTRQIMPTGHLMWDDFDAGSGKTSEHEARKISWTHTTGLIKIYEKWIKEDGAVPHGWREEDLEAELAKGGRACVGELGSQQCVLYYVVLDREE